MHKQSVFVKDSGTFKCHFILCPLRYILQFVNHYHAALHSQSIVAGEARPVVCDLINVGDVGTGL